MSDEPKKPMLALPSTAEETVDVVGMDDTYKLHELGPVGKTDLTIKILN
jgi:hypothetical protein